MVRPIFPRFHGLLSLFALLAFCHVSAAQNVQSDLAKPSQLNVPQSKAVANTKPNATMLRVLSYNIHHGEGVDGRLDLERIARVIKESQADIVSLQEVDVRVQRSGGTDQAAELGRLTDMAHLFGGNIKLQGGEYGNAILTRGRIVQSLNHTLPNIDQGEQRGVLDARIEIDGLTVRVLATHFDHRRDGRERMESIAMVNKLVQDKPPEPTILAGDLNAEFDSPVLQQAASVWTIANQQRLPTIPVGQPARQIDFILTWPAKEWTTQNVQVLDEAIASDHRPILATLSYP